MGTLANLTGGSTGADGIPSGRFRDLFNIAGPLAQGTSQGIQQNLSPLAGQLVGQQQGFLGNLNQAGQQLDPFIGSGFTALQGAGLQSLLNRNLYENLLPGLKSQAAGLGQLGGDLQGVAAGQAMRGTQEALLSGIGDIFQQDLFRRQSAAGQQAGIETGANLGGITAAPQIFNTGLQGFMAPFAPLESYAGMLAQMRPNTQSTTGLIPGLAGLASFNFGG